MVAFTKLIKTRVRVAQLLIDVSEQDDRIFWHGSFLSFYGSFFHSLLLPSTRALSTKIRSAKDCLNQICERLPI
jgi:hypothetical protein